MSTLSAMSKTRSDVLEESRKKGIVAGATTAGAVAAGFDPEDAAGLGILVINDVLDAAQRDGRGLPYGRFDSFLLCGELAGDFGEDQTAEGTAGYGSLFQLLEGAVVGDIFEVFFPVGEVFDV